MGSASLAKRTAANPWGCPLFRQAGPVVAADDIGAVPIMTSDSGSDETVRQSS